MTGQPIRVDAAVAHGSDAPFVTESLLLDGPGPGEIRVRLCATSVCHTDVMTKNKGLCAFPIVLGHEGVGYVDAVGEGVTGFEKDDHVIMSYDYCGHCPQCSKGQPAYCDDHGTLNFSGTRPDGRRTHQHPDSNSADVYGSFFQQSSFATYALSHASNTIKVDKSLDLAELAPLACGVQTGAGTVLNSLQVEPGTSIAIFGCGCVGLSAIMAAKVAGASTIIAVEINSTRRALAAELGATEVVAPDTLHGDMNIVEHLRSLNGGRGCHYAIDTTGIPAVLRQAFDVCGPLGVTAMIAPNVPGTEICVEMLGLLPGKSLRGVVQGDSVSKTFIPYLIDLWQQDRFPFHRMLTRYEGIDKIDTAVRDMASGDVIKPVIVFDDAH